MAYRFDAGRRIVFFDHLREGDPQAAGALCNRHAEVMVLPRGWFLDDGRVPVPRLFTTKTEKAPRSAARKSRSAAPPRSDQLSLVERPSAQTDEVAEGPAATDDADEPGPWSPEFDEGDDLGGLLTATTPLLSRAFRSNPPLEGEADRE